MKIKIQIKSWLNGEVLFEFKKENNTMRDTVLEAIKNSANLIYADLSSANLSSADLSSANLSSADLSYANLSYADLSYANLYSANLSSANLSSADLSYANLSYADLSYANLSSANLSSADLSYANLIYADLSSANLSYGINLSEAKTDKRYIQIGCIGSAKRMTTYCFEDDIVWCGCFKGTLKEFEEKCKETHKDNKQYLQEYLGAINYIKSLN